MPSASGGPWVGMAKLGSGVGLGVGSGVGDGVGVGVGLGVGIGDGRAVAFGEGLDDGLAITARPADGAGDEAEPLVEQPASAIARAMTGTAAVRAVGLERSLAGVAI